MTESLQIEIPNCKMLEWRKDVRKQSWFKMPNSFFTDSRYFGLRPVDRLAYFYILSEASQANSRLIEINFRHLEFCTGIEKSDFILALESLQKHDLVFFPPRNAEESDSEREGDVPESDTERPRNVDVTSPERTRNALDSGMCRQNKKEKENKKKKEKKKEKGILLREMLLLAFKEYPGEKPGEENAMILLSDGIQNSEIQHFLLAVQNYKSFVEDPESPVPFRYRKNFENFIGSRAGTRFWKDWIKPKEKPEDEITDLDRWKAEKGLTSKEAQS